MIQVMNKMRQGFIDYEVENKFGKQIVSVPTIIENNNTLIIEKMDDSINIRINNIESLIKKTTIISEYSELTIFYICLGYITYYLTDIFVSLL